MAFWRAHLRHTYSEQETSAFFAAWAEEDRYVPVDQELALLADAGFTAEVIWRLGPMGVIVATPAPQIARDRQRAE
jgi:hypothetical protein